MKCRGTHINASCHIQANTSQALMSRPLFVHDVKNTSWCIVVTENAGHFYFNKETKQSVWQSDETGLDPETFVANVNFNDLGILFARARGFAIQKSHSEEKIAVKEFEQPEAKDSESEQSDEPDDESQDEDGNEMLRQILEESGLLPENSEGIENTEEPESGDEVSEKPIGLTLGYSSLEEDSEDEKDEDEHNTGLDLSVEKLQETPQETQQEKQQESHGQKHEALEGLDLSISETTVSQEDTQRFIGLLEKHRSSISPYDPWFVVEEELVTQFAQDPVFYAVPEEQRETIFNQWVSDATASKKMPAEGKYPTPELRFFHFLQQYKAEVRKLYYEEFYSAHAKELKTVDFGPVKMEDAFRRLRVKLNDFAQYERNAKKSTAGGSSNLKVEHVCDFVAKNLGSHKYDLPHVPHSGSWFERWIALCNECNLPPKLVNDPTNFIVGDEKRFACYARVLQRT